MVPAYSAQTSSRVISRLRIRSRIQSNGRNVSSVCALKPSRAHTRTHSHTGARRHAHTQADTHTHTRKHTQTRALER